MTEPSRTGAGAAGGTVEPPRSTKALLADPTLSRFLAGNLGSNIGTWMHNIAASIVVYDLTGSALLVGMLIFTQFSPAMLLSLWAGAIADRVDRRKLLMASLLLAGTAGGLLALWVVVVGLDTSGVWPVFVASGLIGLGHAFSVPTLHALLPALVPARDLDEALALTTVTFNLGRTLGPAAAGLVMATLGPGFAFGFNGVSYFVFAGALLMISVPRSLAVGEQSGSVRAGLRFVRGDSVLIVLLAAVAALSIAKDPVGTLAPAIGAAFGGGDTFIGLLVAAFGLGSVVAVTVGGRVRAASGRKPVAIGGFVALGFGLVLVAAVTVQFLALVGSFVAGAGFLFSITALMAGIYGRVPEEFRGRILALWTVAFLGSRPLAGVLNGAVADVFSPRVALVGAAALALATALVLQLRWHEVAPVSSEAGA